MALSNSDILVSNNPEAYGIVKAVQVAGHKTVPNLNSLYSLAACILSESKDNTGNDALGQKWYVVEDSCYYVLKDWEKRGTAEGWSKEEIQGGNVLLTGFEVLPEDQVTEEQLTPSPTDTVNQGIAKLHRAILNNEEVEASAFVGLKEGIGLTDSLEYSPKHPLISGCTSVAEAVEVVAERSELSNVLILSYTTDLASGEVNQPVDPEVSKKLLEGIEKGAACVIKTETSDILSNIQKVGNNVTIVMEQVSKFGGDYIATTTSITIDTSQNKISAYDQGAITLLDKSNGKAFIYQGSKNTVEDILSITNARVGHVWEVKAEFSLSGKKYPGGTKVVCITNTTPSSHTEDHWSSLGGEILVDSEKLENVLDILS